MTVTPIDLELSLDEALQQHSLLVGEKLPRPLRLTSVNGDLIRRFARAIGSRDPLRVDPGYAANSVWGRLVGHPTTLLCFDDNECAPPLAGYQRIPGEYSWEFFQPLLPGDQISAEARLVSVERKTGAFAGDMISETAEVTYTRGDGVVVARARPAILQVQRRAAVERKKYASLTRARYDDAALDEIWQAYQDEAIQGGKVRYWEEVSEGDLLTPIVKGPLVLEDTNVYVQNVSGTQAWVDWLAYMRRHPEDVYWDPDTGLPDSWQSGMWTDKIAQAYGFPSAHSSGSQRLAWMDNLVSNWIGDHGFLRKLELRLTLPCLVADTTWCRGRVVEKLIDEARHLAIVKLSLWSENQRGEVTSTGSAEVLLCSRRVDIPQPLFDQPKRTELPA